MNSTVLQATYQFQPQISIEYDEVKKLYLGRMLIRGLAYDFEGPDAQSVTVQIEDELVREYDTFQRSIDRTRPQERGLSLALPIAGAAMAGGDRDVEQRERSIIDEHTLPLGPTVQGAWKGMEYGSMLHSLLTGNYLELAASLLLGITLKKGGFIAFVGGKRIVAKSRHQLRKEVQRLKNRILHDIIEAMRLHTESREIAMQVHERITMKKQHALDNWEARITGGRPKMEDWRGRVLALRHGVDEKRMDAQKQWVGL